MEQVENLTEQNKRKLYNLKFDPESFEYISNLLTSLRNGSVDGQARCVKDNFSSFFGFDLRAELSDYNTTTSEES